MKHSSPIGLSALVRWRELGESIAAADYRRQNRMVVTAETKLGDAREVANSVHRQRSALLGPGVLDLSKLELAAQMEHEALRQIVVAQEALEVATDACDQARQGYVGARANSRVASERRDRVLAAQRRHEEIALSDRMADLTSAHSRRRK